MPVQIDRRRMMHDGVLQALSAGLVLSGLNRPSQSPAVEPVIGAVGAELPIIDTHQHLWDLSRFRLPWLHGAPEILNRDYLPTDYREASEGLGVVQAVYMEVDVAEEQQHQEADYVLSLCESGSEVTTGAVISGRPNSPGFTEYMKRYRDNKRIKGIRQVLHAGSAERGLCLSPQFVASIRYLGEIGRSFDLCMRAAELSDGAKLAAAAPETRLIVDHCGNADPGAFLTPGEREAMGITPGHDADTWRRDMDALARHPQVICKISGIVAGAPKGWNSEMLAPVINHCLDAFGPARVVFGSDWPVCLLGATYAAWVRALREIVSNRPIEHQRALFHDNAVRYYGLS